MQEGLGSVPGELTAGVQPRQGCQSTDRVGRGPPESGGFSAEEGVTMVIESDWGCSLLGTGVTNTDRVES